MVEQQEIVFIVDAKRVMQLANTGSTKRSWSSAEAQKFLDLFGEEIQERLGTAVKGFVAQKLGDAVPSSFYRRTGI